MTKTITKPIKKIVKPVTNILGGKSKKPSSQPSLGNPDTSTKQITTADIKPNDPRMNMSEQDILASRKKKAKGRLKAAPESSLLYDSNLSQTIG